MKKKKNIRKALLTGATAFAFTFLPARWACAGNLYLDVHFVGNLLFSTYNADLYLEGN